MDRKLALFQLEGDETARTELCLLNWNIANPSEERAKKPFAWTMNTRANLIILTEAKNSKGGRYWAQALKGMGFQTLFPQSSQRDYCVIVASKGFDLEAWIEPLSFLPERMITVQFHSF